MSESTRQFKNGVYEQLSRVAKALAAPKRLELLDLLCQGPRTVESLAGQSAISVANASRHLQVLRAARLVDAEKRGLYVEYRLADEEVCRFYVALRSLATSRLAEIDLVTRAFMERRGGLEAKMLEQIRRNLQLTEKVASETVESTTTCFCSVTPCRAIPLAVSRVWRVETAPAIVL